MNFDKYSDDFLVAFLDLLETNVAVDAGPYSSYRNFDVRVLKDRIKHEISNRCKNRRTLSGDIIFLLESSDYVNLSQEIDGRWIAEVESVPGAMAYGSTPHEARNAALAIALRVMAEKFENG